MSAEEGPRRTIRFEDLGAPIQRLFRDMKGKITEDDMALVQEFVSVKDMAMIFQQLGTDRGSEAIWNELRAALLLRKEKLRAKQMELEDRERQLQGLNAEADADAAEEEQRRADEERARRKAEKRRRKAEEAAAAAAEAEERERLEREAEEAAAAEAAEQARLDAEAAAAAEKKRRKQEKLRKLQEEEARLQAQLADERKAAKRNQKKEWEDFVATHPLEYSESAIQEIKQKPKEETEAAALPRPTLAASAELLNRSWTPFCPHCNAKYSKAPPEWDCTMCLRKYKQRVKTWQPDEKADCCGVCKCGVGRFTRHHCRNCGRVVCGKCSDYRAIIAAIGYTTPVKVCKQCVEELGSIATGAPAQ
jgi:hypothetical protein